MAGTLVVGYDGSDCAKAALAEAARLARLDSSRLVISFAAEPPAPGGEVGEHRRLLEELGNKLVEEALASVSGVQVDGEVVHARPAEALLDLAERHGASTIVVGTHGEAPLMGAILGSVPHKLLHRSKVPVLVVPAPAG